MGQSSYANLIPAPVARHAMNDSAAFIDRLKPDSGISEPVYRQLQRQIIQMIEAGELNDGDSLPSERTLAEALKLSRTTVRRCYDELREQDYISTHGRAGVMVKAPPRINPELGKLKGFTEEMREIGVAPSTQLLERRIVSDRTIASVFNRPSTARFLKLVRLRLGDGIPMTREVAWYDLTIAPALAEWDIEGSAYQFLQQRCGIALDHGEQTIEAAMSNEDEMAVFGFLEPGPCLLLKRKTYATSGQMVEYVEGTFRGDAYTYRITLKMNPEQV
ncbi:MAG TPA: GntR family transcriptional regulator [Candidatus Thiothrix moscowensis]|uniref:GntR family transcriptional regulator n=1 Tax=unclassified Thiothrix TaxID=2636184 RepID=UPI001A237C42|nr:MULTISPECIES: GntR family transcriptional regulator [unclassified Thiothrix]MBJ6611615.1 GntR family transcriptional regulator [Candidatus Thiothrix moscowensis]HRJ53751.1 GntR family transcriptional regulator [Candidatus Thiothrix moscowensis]HRJ93833.1 GntR family transcriptional regulator [Candidatus Thiothrix moscowensis]